MKLFTVEKSLLCGYGIWYNNYKLLELSYSDNPEEFAPEFTELIHELHLEEDLNEILKNNKWLSYRFRKG